MDGTERVSRRLGTCERCREEKLIYFLPSQADREVNCRRCRLPLLFGEANIMEVWRTGDWLFLPISRKVLPDDLELFRRRENIMSAIPPWEQRSLGLAPTRIDHGLAVIRRVRWQCTYCPGKTQRFCLTEFAIRRATCVGCGNKPLTPKITEHVAGLTKNGSACIIASMSPLSPVIVDRPTELSVMSTEDLELLGIL